MVGQERHRGDKRRLEVDRGRQEQVTHQVLALRRALVRMLAAVRSHHIQQLSQSDRHRSSDHSRLSQRA